MMVRVGNQNLLISLRVITLMVIVISLGMILKMDLWTPPESIVHKKISPLPQRLMANAPNTRAPSSINSRALNEIEVTQKIGLSVIDERVAEPHVTTMGWDCSSKNQVIRLSQVEQLRLSGKCLKDLKRIVNQSNGYTANIFQLKDSATTDYLSLNSGSNQLQLEWLDGATSNSPKVLEIIVEKQ